VATSLRSALKATSRQGSALSSSKYGRRLADVLHWLHPDDQVEVLLRVEDGTRADEPLLSSMLAVVDAAPALYRDLAARLGRQVLSTASEARAHWQTETLRLQQTFQHR
jgi:hypothetical protein